MPKTGTTFVCACLVELQPILAATRALLGWNNGADEAGDEKAEDRKSKKKAGGGKEKKNRRVHAKPDDTEPQKDSRPGSSSPGSPDSSQKLKNTAVTVFKAIKLESAVQKKIKKDKLKLVVGYMSLRQVSDWFLYTRQTRLLPTGHPSLLAVDGVLRELGKTWRQVLELNREPYTETPHPDLEVLVTASDCLCVLANLWLAVEYTGGPPSLPTAAPVLKPEDPETGESNGKPGASKEHATPTEKPPPGAPHEPVPTTESAKSVEEEKLPPGWERKFSKLYGTYFYYKKATRESLWELPAS